MSTEIEQDLERYTADALYFDANREELISCYPEQWVAVYQKQVVGAAMGVEGLVAQLQQNGIPRGRAYVEYATGEAVVLIVALIQT